MLTIFCAKSLPSDGKITLPPTPILDRGEFYSGCYGRASVTFYAFNNSGNRGIACGLNNLQKLRDGEPLGGRMSAEQEFGALVDEADEDDFLK